MVLLDKSPIGLIFSNSKSSPMFFQSSDEEVEVGEVGRRSMEKVVLITNFYRWLVLNSNVCFLVLILMRSREKVLLCLSPALCRAPLCTI